VAVGALEPKFWAVLCDVLGADGLSDRQHDEDQGAVAAELGALLAPMTRAEVRERFAGVDACVTVVASYEEMLESTMARERGLIRSDPTLPMPVLAPPFVIDGERPPERGGAPRQGEHSLEVLREAGFTDDEVRALESAGATRQGPAA
jgi:alpha-methylacyl-CoA racemase